MRRFIPTFLIIILVLAVYPFIGMDNSDKPKLSGLPWQIEILPDGNSKIFGVTPGQSTLQQAATVLGDDYKLAIVENASGISLEMYFGNYRAGLMAAKMVLVAETDAQQLRQWQQRAIKSDYMETGTAKKYALDETDKALAMRAVLRAIAFIPAVNLDDEIVRKRFGEPAELIETGDGIKHYLYPEKGLVIALGDKAKEVLQYVAPQNFNSLRAPLVEN